ncbi:hypothetical protein BDY19DRAFT_996881 [Irpex rosettiformis]|uniref:Uncharacterized protein n=1 Tax=Irpex rosettiformis TaxID=378272 RepID=A0ACB8TTP2_9APHY|nr:hypothetical protein BDY19DRAFT_996881 [Irpex rosettiformis]
MLCALAIGDHINSSATSKDVVLNNLNTMFTLIPDIIGSESRKLTSDAALNTLDEIDLGICNTSTKLVTYNSGSEIEELSVLVDVVPRNTTEEYASLCVDTRSLISNL